MSIGFSGWDNRREFGRGRGRHTPHPHPLPTPAGVWARRRVDLWMVDTAGEDGDL